MESESISQTRNFYSSKNICQDLESLSLSSLSEKSVVNVKPRKLRKNFSNLSISTDNINTSEEVNSSPSYHLKDHFDMIRTLGMGTYSYVRLATEKKTGKQVAIKTSRGSNSRELLKKEYELLKRLSDDNIIRVFNYIEDSVKKESYLVLEYFNGQNLSEYIEENGALGEQKSKIILKQLLTTIENLHELGIAHRDIKPENILINEDLEIKLIDFNISKAKDPN